MRECAKMLLSLSLAALTVPVPMVPQLPASNSSSIVFAFTGGEYDGYQQWDWETITHLGFWTKPSDDVRMLARQHGVKLFHDCSTPDKKDWTDKDKRAKFAQGCAADVKDHDWDGVFFGAQQRVRA